VFVDARVKIAGRAVRALRVIEVHVGGAIERSAAARARDRFVDDHDHRRQAGGLVTALTPRAIGRPA
jgi:hypothetical protein